MIDGSNDTVFALASGTGRAAVAVFRVSGPASGTVLDRICSNRPLPRRASLRTLYDADGLALDRAIVLWLPGPGSYTGEDCLEFHVHGSRAVLRDVATALTDFGLRPAEAGEFSRRAFLNGRMDLLEAEGLADLIDAETTAQRRQALKQLDGGLGQIMGSWAATLTNLLAQQEALIDFPDEAIPAALENQVHQDIQLVLAEMRSYLEDARRGERLRQGLTFVIVGAPNAGKSTLLNKLACRDIAIVSPHPGTTRDILEARLELDGVPVTILDTAGVRATGEAVEAEGVHRALTAAATADLLILVETPWEPAPCELSSYPQLLRVVAKADLPRTRLEQSTEGGAVIVSAVTGEGMAELHSRLSATARDLALSFGPAPLTRERHRAALRAATEDLERALIALYPEMRAEDLRLALRALGRITGRVGVEDVLDSVFRQFCIGK